MNSQKASEIAKTLYNDFGQRKYMGNTAPSNRHPLFFLLRSFLGDNDLAILFNTKRCQYQCSFCQLPAKSSKVWIPSDDIIVQFEYIMHEVKHALSILDRISISNEGSVLDQSTFPTSALLEITDCINELRRVRTFVIETRVEFVDIDILSDIKKELRGLPSTLLQDLKRKMYM